MIISIDAEKSSENIQLLFKTLNKLKVDRRECL